MIAALIRWSIASRFLVLLATLMVSAWGVWSLYRTPLDGHRLIEQLGVVRPQVQVVLDRLKDVPVDIEPRFVTAQQLLADTSR